MRLKEISLKGFKSFPDKTVINFKEGITGIVGPNGSGKSNISDAIRWVLGEQSAKTLRGAKMEDVIFSGTEKRKPLGFCEVAITFDNTSGYIPLDYKEVEITRRVFRSGESEYYINKNACRLKDIRELLMDTGIGKEGYSIVGQGKIEEILSSRPEDRRNIFEEAAGIVKYKSKKEESERKLLRTEDNLSRVNDLVSELEGREDKLRDQAERASSYKELYEEKKYLDLGIYSNEMYKLKNNIDTLNNDIKTINKELEKKQEYKKELIININKVKQELEERENKLSIVNKEKYESLGLVESKKSKIDLLKEKESFNLKDLERLTEENTRFKERARKKEEENNNLSRDINKLEIDLDNLVKNYKKEKNNLADKLDKINNKEKSLEENKDTIMEIYNEISNKKSELNGMDIFSENITSRINQLKEEILENNKYLNINAKDIENLKASREGIVEKLDKAKEEIKESKLELLKKENDLSRYNQEISQLNINIETNLSNYRVYKNMEDSYEGYYKGVKEILKASNRDEKIKNSLIGVIADLINVDEKYELAIGIALGGNSQNIVTPSQADGKVIIDYLRNNRLGRVTCLPLDTIKGNILTINQKDRENYSVIGIASELVSYNKNYKNIIESLLGRTVIVDNMDSAIGLSNKYRNSLRIVTLKGDLINPGGSMTGGSNVKDNNILARKNKLDRIESNVKSYKGKKLNLEKERDVIISDTSKLDEKLNLLEESVKDKEYKIFDIKNKLNNKLEELDRINKVIKTKEKEIESLKNNEKSYKTKKDKLKDDIEALSNKLEATEKLTRSLAMDLDKLKKNNQDVINKTTDSKIIINKKENELKNLKDRLINNNNDIEQINSEIKNNLKTEKEIEVILEDISKEFEKTKTLIKKLEDELLYKEEIIREVKSSIDKLREKSLSEEEVLFKVNNDTDSLLEKTNKKYLYKEKEILRLESFRNRLMDEYEMIQDHIEIDKYINIDYEQARGRLKEIKEEIKSLGSINLLAIDEYNELFERLSFIKLQQKDLVEAKKDLNKVIEDIEKVMNEKFMESFIVIQENFADIFKVLFNGGRANIILTDKENILNTGIDIEAQPPGKRLQSLTSLSGGERSLTAVALLFAILKMKPSPFCILDEIDAALDEANIGRYTKYLEDISDDTQFIIITHRKTTMEIVDTLYGITMEEKGVSKLLSIELTEYEEEVS